MSISNAYRELVKIDGLKVVRGVILAPHTTLKIGGRADILIVPKTETALLAALLIAKKQKVRHIVIGNGSKVLFPDSGFRGMVIKMAGGLDKIEVDGTNVRVGSGVMLPKLISELAKKGLGGLEFAFGVPATAGGATYMNFGAMKHQWSERLKSVRFINRSLKIVEFDSSKIKFGYRYSGLMRMKALVTGIEFSMDRGSPAKIRRKMKEAALWRKTVQPMVIPNCGSIFKNPVGDSAGRLIQKAGLMGKRVGDAQISTKHGNFIVNLGKARSSDVLSLMKKIKRAVKRSFNITLEPEIRVIKP